MACGYIVKFIYRYCYLCSIKRWELRIYTVCINVDDKNVIPLTADLAVRGKGVRVIRLNPSSLAGSCGTDRGGWRLSFWLSQRVCSLFSPLFLCLWSQCTQFITFTKTDWCIQMKKKHTRKNVESNSPLLFWALTIVLSYWPVGDRGQG